MQYLYLWLDLGSFIVPFIFSFHPRLRFYKRWKGFLLGTLVMMAVFIPWDIAFTVNGFWGFNPDYLSGIYLFSLPIEEWLFFICIPYACIFTHYALIELFPKVKLSDRATSVIYTLLVSVLVIMLWYNYDTWSTGLNFSYALVVLGLVYNWRKQLFNRFFLTYLVILIPFFLVNGVLTGTGIDEQVVWYNNDQNLVIRMGTIPVEDTIYNLGMLLTVLAVTVAVSGPATQRMSKSSNKA